MAGQFYTSGPVACYCGVGDGGAPMFLGYGRQAPRIAGPQVQWRPIQSDFAGAAPAERAHGGEVVQVRVSLNYFSNATVRVLRDTARAPLTVPAASASPGTQNLDEMGGLQVAEGLGHELWLRFIRSGRAAFQNAITGVQEAGYRFFNAGLDGIEDQPGWEPRTLDLTWTCLRPFDPNHPGDVAAGGFRLYDFDMSKILALPVS